MEAEERKIRMGWREIGLKLVWSALVWESQ